MKIQEVKNIAIIRLGAIGDIIHALPVASRIKNENPQIKITWIVEKRHVYIIENNKNIDRIITTDTKSWRRQSLIQSWPQIKRLIKKIKQSKFDVVLDLQGLIKSGIISYLTAAKYRLGFNRPYCREGLNYYFNNIHITPAIDDEHIIDRNLAFLRYFDIKGGQWNWGIKTTPADKKYIDDFWTKEGLVGNKRIIGINPGAGWITKCWDTGKYAILCDKLAQKDYKVILTWGPGEQDTVDKIVDKTTNKPIIACNTTVNQLTELISRCSLYVAGDTGPLHIAAALGVPTLALYGPSSPIRNGPYGQGHKIIYHELSCSNCYKRKCASIECMELISVEEVLQAIRCFSID